MLVDVFFLIKHTGGTPFGGVESSNDINGTRMSVASISLVSSSFQWKEDSVSL